MLRGIRSRSHSRDNGLANEVVVHVIPNEDVENIAPVPPPGTSRATSGRTTPESGMGNIPGPDQAEDLSFQFMQGHPSGRVLLQMYADITRLAQKAKLTNMSTNFDDLCNHFANGIQLERDNFINTIEQRGNEMENKLLTMELQAHRTDSEVEAPNNFSPVPTLLCNPGKLRDCQGSFKWSQLFNGTPGTLSVIEFLTNLNLAQAQCNLSESEFIDRILANSTGKARDLIKMWADNGNTAAEIYELLIMQYDKKPNIDEIKLSLLTYKVAKNEDLAVAEGKIMRWVGMIAKAVPIGTSRDTYYNHECYQALLRALPEWSHNEVESKHASLSTKAGRSLTFAELHKAINQLRPLIDRDIKRNGAEKQKWIPNKKVKKTGNPQIFNLEIKPNTDTVMKRKYPNNKGNTDTSFTPKPTTRYFNNRTNNKNNNNTGKQDNNGKPFQKNNFKNGKQPFVQTQGKMGTGCILCGYKNHQAKDCRNMKDDNGVIKQVLAPYGKCNICPASIQPRLNHPPSLCPFRPKGPLAGRAN
jgi:hypothetical protein